MDAPSAAAYTSLDDETLAPKIDSISLLSASTAHSIDLAPACPLLDIPIPIYTLCLSYMDDLAAVRYLATCRSLHARYHDYAVKRPLTDWAFRKAVKLDSYFARYSWLPLYAIVAGLLWVTAMTLLIVFIPQRLEWTFWAVYYTPVLVGAVALSGYIMWLLAIRPRRHCCVPSRWGMWRRHCQLPRLTRLRGRLRDMQLLPYLQHLTELTIAYDSRDPFGGKRPLPRSLHTLQLLPSPSLALSLQILPAQLRTLSLSAINMPLATGALPASLTCLRLLKGFDIRFGIQEGVLPAGLLRLELYEWTLPLSAIALPSSLVELHIRWLSNTPILTLPPQLEVLCIGGAFSQPLVGVLPVSLRVLRLSGHFDHRLLTAELFASTPLLQELFVSCRDVDQLQPAGYLPRSRRLMRLSEQGVLGVLEVADVPAEHREEVVPAEWDAERMRSFEEQRVTDDVA